MDQHESPTSHCNQGGCGKPAAFRFTWPGRDEAGICEGHAPALRNIASAIGCYVKLIPIETKESSDV